MLVGAGVILGLVLQALLAPRLGLPSLRLVTLLLTASVLAITGAKGY